jgi:2-oxo-3-hexenedioate decarboxylase
MRNAVPQAAARIAGMLGEELIDLHEAPRLVAPFTQRYPHLSADDGYAAARVLHAHRLAKGWKPLGRKIGFTNRSLWERYGVHEPIWGFIYDRTLIAAEGDQAVVPLEGLMNPRIEPELCFRLKSAPSSADPQHLLQCIEWIAHACEIVHCPHPDWKLKLPDSTASNGLHGRLVTGTPVEVRKLPDLAAQLPRVEAELYKGSSLVERGLGEIVLGSPLLALGHLVTLLARQAAPPLAAGEIVTTGTLTDAHAVRPHEAWRTAISGLPLRGLGLRFT